ncbi:SMI1/KNR4 family protein [Arachnia propionica]|uniref:SMI1/KNR4 family protein n=1 Tax=Arachnia propionica TaxID=1750 RepID=A0A3P1TA56_9ACTN|nr:SMI1/KNR4 family protein [Arachnia propionica]
MRRVIGWHRDPLVAADGCTAEELAVIEERLGLPLPAVLREWFEILGHRLRAVQDPAATPETITRDGDRIVIWTEDQEAWLLLVPAGGDDPVAELEFSPHELPTSVWLTGMLISECLGAMWSWNDGTGPLGEFRPGVRGDGPMDEVNASVFAAVPQHYPELPWPLPPMWQAWHGDDETVIRVNGTDVLEWFTTSDAAHARIRHLLAEGGGTPTVVARISGITEEEHERHSESGRFDPWPDQGIDEMAAVLSHARRMSTATGAEPDRWHEMTLPTDDPETLAAALVASLAPTWGDRLTVAWRADDDAPCHVVHPSGGEFTRS